MGYSTEGIRNQMFLNRQTDVSAVNASEHRLQVVFYVHVIEQKQF